MGGVAATTPLGQMLSGDSLTLTYNPNTGIITGTKNGGAFQQLFSGLPNNLVPGVLFDDSTGAVATVVAAAPVATTTAPTVTCTHSHSFCISLSLSLSFSLSLSLSLPLFFQNVSTSFGVRLIFAKC